MGAATNATRVWSGTPTYDKGIFHQQIQTNKREALKRGRGTKVNHFEIDWRTVAKYVPQYERFVLKEMRDMGADSDEFRLSYKIEWLLEKGMFTTSEEFNDLSDICVQSLEKSWHWSPRLRRHRLRTPPGPDSGDNRLGPLGPAGLDGVQGPPHPQLAGPGGYEVGGRSTTRSQSSFHATTCTKSVSMSAASVMSSSTGSGTLCRTLSSWK